MTEKIKRTNKFNLDGLSAKRAVKKPPGLSPWQKICIAIISGAILALASPGFDQWWLAWFMVAPFLVLLGYCNRRLEPLLIGFCFAFTYHLISLHYYFSIIGPGREVSIVVWLLQAFLLSLPTTGFAWLAVFLPLRPGYIPYFRRPFFPYLIAIPLLWVFLHWGLSIAHPLAVIWKFAPFPPLPTDLLIYSQYNVLPMLQLLKYVGPSGLEFILLLVNAVIAAFIVELVKTREGPVERVDAISPRAGAVLDLFVAAVIVTLLYSMGQSKVEEALRQSKEFLQYDKANELTQPILPVGIVADNRALLRKDVFITEKQLAMVIFPETNKEINLDQINNVVNVINITGQKHNTVLVSFISDDKKSIRRENLILFSNSHINIKQSIYCAAGLFILNDILANNADNKKSPLLSTAFPIFLQEWLFGLDRDDPSSWYSVNLPKISWGKFGLLSGSDLADFRLAAHEVRRGASLLVSSTNLSWMGNHFLSKQLLASAIFRAIENNRYVILCANGGVLAVIEPSGIVQSLFFQSPMLVKQQNEDASLLLGRIQFLWSKTPFTKTWWL